MTYWHFVAPLASRSSRREDAVVYRASFSNEAVSLALRLWNKSNNLTHGSLCYILTIIPSKKISQCSRSLVGLP